MEVWKLTKHNQSEIVNKAKLALKAGKSVVYPTDTTYALGVLVENRSAIKKLYRIKLRDFSKPVHVLVPSIREAKKLVKWNKFAEKLAKKFLPGPLSLALKIKTREKVYTILSAKTGFLGFRISNDSFSRDLSKAAGILTATSANPAKNKAKGFDPYSAEHVIRQFRHRQHKPDIIIDAGRLKRIKPSTFVKIDTNGEIQILRKGPISIKRIRETLNMI